jgi:hypothetical protein
MQATIMIAYVRSRFIEWADPLEETNHVTEIPMSLDTLKYSKQLENAGVPRAAAEAHAAALREIVIPDLATKADLVSLEERLLGKFDGLLWKHSVAELLGMMAIAGFAIRFIK